MYKLQFLKFIQDFELRRGMLFLKKEKKNVKSNRRNKFGKKKKKDNKKSNS